MTRNDFDSLVRPEVERLYRLAFRLTGTRADAEDLVQETLVRACERREELSAMGAPGAWLSRVLYNRFIDDRRKFERRRLSVVGQGADADEAVEHATPESEASRSLDISALRAALAVLSIEQRAVLLMHDAEGYKLDEIHTITGVEIGTLKSRLHRGRARLREQLAAEGTF